MSFRCYDLVTQVAPLGRGLPTLLQATENSEAVERAGRDSSQAFRRLLARSGIKKSNFYSCLDSWNASIARRDSGKPFRGVAIGAE